MTPTESHRAREAVCRAVAFLDAGRCPSPPDRLYRAHVAEQLKASNDKLWLRKQLGVEPLPSQVIWACVGIALIIGWCGIVFAALSAVAIARI